MTFKDLQRALQSQSQAEPEPEPEQSQLLLQRLKDKPFWVWIRNNHKRLSMIHKDNCCFFIFYELEELEMSKLNLNYFIKESA